MCLNRFGHCLTLKPPAATTAGQLTEKYHQTRGGARADVNHRELRGVKRCIATLTSKEIENVIMQRAVAQTLIGQRD